MVISTDHVRVSCTWLPIWTEKIFFYDHDTNLSWKTIAMYLAGVLQYGRSYEPITFELGVSYRSLMQYVELMTV